MAGNICCCGSNRTSLRVMIGIHLIYAALMVIFSGAEMAIYHNINAEDLRDIARSRDVDLESMEPGLVLGVVRGISIIALVFNVIHLLFAIFGAIGESQNRPGFLLAWGIYLSILLAFFSISFIVSIPSGPGGVAIAILLLIIFLGFTLKLTQYRYDEIKVQGAAAALSGGGLSAGGQAYIFTSVVNNDAYGGGGGALMAVDGAGGAAVQQEKKDLPPAYGEACGVNVNYP